MGKSVFHWLEEGSSQSFTSCVGSHQELWLRLSIPTRHWDAKLEGHTEGCVGRWE